MWPATYIPPTLACPGCSMFNLTSFAFLNPQDLTIALCVVAAAIVAVFLPFALGLRLGGRRQVTATALWSYRALLFFGWIIMGCAGPYSPNLGVFLLHWVYLPLTIQYNILLWPAWDAPVLLIGSALLIPACYCFYLPRWVLGADRQLVWRPHVTASRPAPTYLTQTPPADISPPPPPPSPDP